MVAYRDGGADGLSSEEDRASMYKIYNRNISFAEISLSGSPVHAAALSAV